MARTIQSLLRRGALLALAAFVTLPLVSTASAQDRAEREAERVERLADALDLTDAQKQVVADAEAEPGALWNVAAALAPTLTAEQKATLFTRPERPERADRPRSARAERPRGDRTKRERPDADARAERWEARHEAMQTAMRSALDLTDEQVSQLDALHETRKAEREQRRADRQERMQDRPAPGELPAELAAILTPEQQEVFKVHRALAMHTHHGRRHARR